MGHWGVFCLGCWQCVLRGVKMSQVGLLKKKLPRRDEVCGVREGMTGAGILGRNGCCQ